MKQVTDTVGLRSWVRRFSKDVPGVSSWEGFSTITEAELAAQCCRRFAKREGLALKVRQREYEVHLEREVLND